MNNSEYQSEAETCYESASEWCLARAAEAARGVQPESSPGSFRRARGVLRDALRDDDARGGEANAS